jgi:hypothetical protein
LKKAKVTTKQVTALMNVSERSVYTARKVMRLRPDLEPAIMAGRMSLNEALRVAEERVKPTSWDRLVKAWSAATDEDRARLLHAATGFSLTTSAPVPPPISPVT